MESNEKQIKVRPAGLRDVEFIARALVATAGGMYEYLLGDRLGEGEILAAIAQSLAQEARADSYRSVLIAESDGRRVGMVSAYPSRHHRIDAEMRRVLPAEKLASLYGFFSTRVPGSIYINAIYVVPEYRGQGIAGALLEAARQGADLAGICGLSLLVMTHNTAAIRSYQGRGMEIRRQIPFKGDVKMPGCGGFYLMADPECGGVEEDPAAGGAQARNGEE